ncbi:hypothetical protein RYA99_24295 [Pseudomonas syringae pv. actinidifoliorum]|uniref:Uncharacterized protein n=1 Tax=Pseudomonas syringae pv. actinidiae ICMP 18807 TaxID=1194404 RepID=S6VEZ0_PSESF|nr:hypothetical protein [Pseudomonas syringae]EPN52706.1 hypothetical protein A244_16994 [Pseudomonas syringae pv. actinidiae ICMP 18807]MDU8428289.1 hypothetical protein [Pseudomonas syringae pv. actinidifoliorum]MDU8522664.1 hypothetical protein [Pseudomonas syringae pv. actinidifoliorum]MDU8529280.1 hypothetical protein [Pseudomonas syringae pv. actinidifoliorum]
MSKIVIAANAMIANKSRISDVLPGDNDNEVFFLFDRKYKWSAIKRADEHYALFYYPGRQTIESLAGMRGEEWAEFSHMVSYNSKDIGTKESLDTFRDLYMLVNGMKYGMEQVLDDIIESADF